MNAFEYVAPTSIKDAIAALNPNAKPMGGGIDLVQEIKDEIIAPERVVNLKTIPGLTEIRADNRGVTFGALCTLSAIANHAQIKERYPGIALAAASVGSPQIRNVGTIGGNLCQRPRCWYYRDHAVNCMKKGGPKCYSVAGENQYHAILGGGPCFIVHPSDLAPALMAYGAQVTIAGPKGEREMDLAEFFVLPSKKVTVENILAADEIVTKVFVPAGTANSAYVKVRERESFDWALASAAAALTISNGVCESAKVVMGGVAPIPWRSPEAEAALKGKKIDDAVALAAGAAAVSKAIPMTQNAYKMHIAKNAVREAVLLAAGLTAG